jgi:hypothetical protein
MIENHVVNRSQLFVVHAIYFRAAQVVNIFQFVVMKKAVMRHSCSLLNVSFY